MPKTAREYGQWIIENESKKGTPEFEIVAEAYKKARASEKTGEKTGLDYMGQGERKGIANTLGAPVDLTNLALTGANRLLGMVGPGQIPTSKRPIGGSSQFTDLLGTYQDIGEVPERHRPLAVAGETLTEGTLMSALPFLKTARMKPTDKAKGVFAPIITKAQKKPGRFLAIEALTNAYAAGGAGAAEKIDPGNPYLRTGLEVAAGTGGPMRAAGVLAGKVGEKVGTPMQSTLDLLKSPHARAARTLQRLGRDIAGEGWAEDVASRLNRDDAFPGEDVTAGVLANDPVLLAIEKKLARTDREFSAKLKTQYATTARAFEEQIKRATSGGNSAVARSLMNERAKWFRDTLEGYKNRAVTKAQESLGELGPTVKRAEASKKASQELENSLNSALDVERELWSDVNIDRGIPITPNGVGGAFEGVRSELLSTEKLPEVLNAFLREVTSGDELKEITSGDLLRLRNRALSLSRAERQKPNPDWSLHRHLNMIADGALDDLSGVPGVEAARDFSRAKNEVFSRGPVGDLLGYGKGGGRRVDPELFLKEGIGGLGEEGAVRGRKIEEAARFQGKTTMPEQEQYLRGAVFDRAGKFEGYQTKHISTTSGQDFLQNNRELMEQHPRLAESIERAIQDELKSKYVAGKTANQIDLLNKKSPLFKFITADDPVVGLGRVIKGDTPFTDYQSLVRTARRSGPEAVDGLRSVTMDWVITQGFKPDGTFSANAMREALTKTVKTPSGEKSILQIMSNTGVINSTQQKNLMATLRRGERLEAAYKSGAEINEFMDSPDMLSDLLARLIGASAGGGSALARSTGSSFVMAHAGSKAVREIMGKLPMENTANIIKEAILNPELMRGLLTRKSAARIPKQLERQINSYLFSTLIPIPSEE